MIDYSKVYKAFHFPEVLCQKAELIDLSARPDVETFDWDGEDVDYATYVK